MRTLIVCFDLIVSTFIYMLFFYNNNFCYKIKDKNCVKQKINYDPNSNFIESMDISIKGTITSDSVCFNMYNIYIDDMKYYSYLKVKLKKGYVDTIFKDYGYGTKGFIEYLPYSIKNSCDNELKIKIKLHKKII